MKLEDQVCTLEQAKKLKDLGVYQRTLCTYFDIPGSDPHIAVHYMLEPGNQVYAAFTCSELGVMCPYQMMTYYSEHTGSWGWQLYELVEDEISETLIPKVWASNDEFETEAEARADCLIYSSPFDI